MTDNLVNGDLRTLGSLGEVGALAFGCWRFVDSTTAGARERIETALDNGMNLIDTADIYGFAADGSGFGAAEQILGSVLGSDPGLRDRIVLATKGGIRPPIPYDQSPPYLRQACEDSLRRLQVDVIDLYQIHRPDTFTHPESVASTLAALRNEGKIREVGVSNYTVAQYDALARFLPFPMVTNQPQFSAAYLDPFLDGTLDSCMRDGVTPMAWSPLAGGRLATGEPGSDGSPTPGLMAVIDRLAQRESVGRDIVALASSSPIQPVRSPSSEPRILHESLLHPTRSAYRSIAMTCTTSSSPQPESGCHDWIDRARRDCLVRGTL